MSRIKILFLIIIKIITFKIKISFKIPKHYKIVVFDKISFTDMKYILEGEDYFVLEARYDQISTIYFNHKIFFGLLRNKYKNIFTSYIVEIINIVKPNLIITLSDNSLKFLHINKIFQNKIRTMAIQNGTRYEFNLNNHLEKFLKKNNNKLFFYDIYLSLGEYEIEQLKNFKIPFAHCVPVGSLRLSNALKYFEENDIKIKKNYYDICLISDAIANFDRRYKIPSAEIKFFTMVKNILKFSKENNLKLVVCLKRADKKDLDIELSHYAKYLTNDELNYLKENVSIRSTLNKSDYYKSYLNMMESKLTIACFSTMLRENIALGKKALSYNLIPTNNMNFISKNICALKNANYQEFSERAKLLLNMSEQAYLNELGNDKEKIIYNNESISTISLIKKYMSKINENPKYNFNS